MNKSIKRVGNVLQGMYLIALGVFLIGENLGMFNIIHELLYQWQIVLIAVGIFQILGFDIFGGLMTVIIGTFFYLPLLGIDFVSNWRILIPTLIVLLGLKIIFKGMGSNFNEKKKNYQNCKF